MGGGGGGQLVWRGIDVDCGGRGRWISWAVGSWICSWGEIEGSLVVQHCLTVTSICYEGWNVVSSGDGGGRKI